MDTKIIEVKNNLGNNSNDYGKFIDKPNNAPSKKGDGWKCWSPVEVINFDKKFWIGIVEKESQELIVKEMERHISRKELVWPAKKPIIQPLALSYKENKKEIDIKSVIAVLIKPGQMLMINSGVWHSAAFTISETNDYFFAIEENSEDLGDKNAEWVKLKKKIIMDIDNLDLKRR